MKRLKRALSVTKTPRIEESIAEIDEYLKDTHLETHAEHPAENDGEPNNLLGNNNSREGNEIYHTPTTWVYIRELSYKSFVKCTLYIQSG